MNPKKEEKGYEGNDSEKEENDVDDALRYLLSAASDSPAPLST